MRAILVLEDGTAFEGESFGAGGEAGGEAVFNTSMTGYQEIITDPSYRGQIVAMTYPLIGNYGVNAEDVESGGPQVEGLVVRELSRVASNYRSTMTLDEYLRRHGVVGIQGVDTRALTRHIRLAGAMRAVISTTEFDREALAAKARGVPPMAGRDLVREVTPSSTSEWTEELSRELEISAEETPSPRYRVVAIDTGLKRNIARLLLGQGLDVTLVPATMRAEEIRALEPQGVFLANGPGDPAALDYVVETIRELLGEYPMFGICLGHQLMGRAFGAKTYKLKFGHHGANQPVQDLSTGRVSITSQNHGFAVDTETLDESQVRVTEINLNDGTVEGLEHRRYAAFCVQYHPEAAPGPHDARGHFARFRRIIAERARQGE